MGENIRLFHLCYAMGVEIMCVVTLRVTPYKIQFNKYLLRSSEIFVSGHMSITKVVYAKCFFPFLTMLRSGCFLNGRGFFWPSNQDSQLFCGFAENMDKVSLSFNFPPLLKVIVKVIDQHLSFSPF